MRILAVAFAAVICRDALNYALESFKGEHRGDSAPAAAAVAGERIVQGYTTAGGAIRGTPNKAYNQSKLYQVQQQLFQLMADNPSVATTTVALIVLTFLFLMLFGGIIRKKKMAASSTNNAVEGSKGSVEGETSASGADLTSDDGSVQKEVDDMPDLIPIDFTQTNNAMTGYGDNKTSR